MIYSNLTDEVLAISHRDRKLNATLALYLRYKNYGCAIFINELKKTSYFDALIEDKECIVYQSVIKTIECYEPEKGTFRSLFASILVHLTLRRVNKFRQDPLSDYISLDSQEMGDLLLSDSIVDQTAQPKDRLFIKDTKKAFKKAYSSINVKRLGQMISLKECGFTYEEIAKRYNLSGEAVRQLFYRLRKAILKESPKR